MFDKKKYQLSLSTRWLGRDLIYHKEIGSTNTYLKKLPVDKVSHGQLCITDYQRQGRGQHQKKWASDRGQNLIFTIALIPSHAERFHTLTLACAYALALQVEETVEQSAHIKWPNDVYIQHKKVAGILTETQFSGNSLDRLIIGIGINVNQSKFSEDLQSTATSLKQVSCSEIDREVFLSELLYKIECEYERWLERSDEQLKQINQKIVGHGQWVSLKVDKNTLDDKYKLLGINKEDQLAGINQDGDIKSFSYEQVRVITN